VSLEKQSPCKVNLLLNILGRRADGFHELETLLYPLPVFDRLIFTRKGQGIQLSCSAPDLPTDAGNLVYRAAAAFLKIAQLTQASGGSAAQWMERAYAEISVTARLPQVVFELSSQIQLPHAMF
jgi:4-diphosphocytidyl-2C-methyl-D-erythritol kinase